MAPAPGRRRGALALLAGLTTCAATVLCVTWLSNILATQHAAASGLGESRQTLMAGARLGAGQAVQVGVRSERQQPANPQLTVRRKHTRAQARADALPGAQLASKATTTKAAAAADRCQAFPNTDYWGDALVWGNQHRKPSADACCAACQAYRPPNDDSPACNVWVYCGDKAACGEHYQECWLKHLLRPESSKPKEGPDIPWVSGVFDLPPPVDYEALTKDTGEDRSFHTVITAQGTATHWQSRVHYYWFKKVQKECRARGVCHMGGFTRLLHSGAADELVKEIPTHVVQPLEDKENKGYLVLNRPWAFVQWLQQATFPEKYVFMSEPDHIWLKPMPNLAVGGKPAAFPFFYIEPAKADYVPITQKFTGKLTRQQLEAISPIGNAPTLLSTVDLKRMAPTWMNVSRAIFNDAEANKAWGWVLEMYGFTIASFLTGIPPATLHLKMMAQPPWDNDVPWGPSFFLLHYTYGMDYTKEGKFTPGKVGEWRFDKRTYSGQPPPRGLGEPPPGMDNTLVRHLIHAINEASAAIPGWDEYAKTGVAKQLWDGRV